MTKKFAIQSLGCAKNLTDTEQMLAKLLTDGWELVEDPDEADIGIVNTCAFIEDAKKESIEAILEMAQCRDTGALVALVVTGCMAQRYQEEIRKELPEVDALLGTANIADIAEVCDRLLEESERGRMQKIARFGDINAELPEIPRVQSTPEYTAYLKIAEGCDNHCAYCVIPSLRGRYRSRTMENLVGEATALAHTGVRELIVIAQDITRYGTDLYGEQKLPELLTRLCAIDGIEWIRLHYLYPSDITPEMVDVIAREPKILKYLDVPVQHCSDRVLERMNRRDTKASLESTIAMLRKRIPGVVLRTTLLVGFPGETEDDFNELCEFVKKQKFERLGVFPYSREEGTPAYDMSDQVDEDEKIQRAETVMKLQERVVSRYNTRQLGTKRQVLVEGFDRAGGCYYGRSFSESPDIDGKVFFLKPKKARPQEGEFVTVTIREDLDGDLVGEYAEADTTVLTEGNDA
ncbi:MAG: 30S ribosomal protein S12 methylthiotransferase RimO [Clostridiales bacterium]|jgi:ribosomal protein S12 methylthiotransferase|nr:30S ribosomal protein S12 methylthiotransferase RimO [Clostridiales bacterium]